MLPCSCHTLLQPNFYSMTSDKLHTSSRVHCAATPRKPKRENDAKPKQEEDEETSKPAAAAAAAFAGKFNVGGGLVI